MIQCDESPLFPDSLALRCSTKSQRFDSLSISYLKNYGNTKYLLQIYINYRKKRDEEKNVILTRGSHLSKYPISYVNPSEVLSEGRF